jgi:hypothetical protein
VQWEPGKFNVQYHALQCGAWQHDYSFGDSFDRRVADDVFFAAIDGSARRFLVCCAYAVGSDYAAQEQAVVARRASTAGPACRCDGMRRGASHPI